MLSMMKALAYYLRGSNMVLAFVLVFVLCCSVESIAIWMHFNVPWFEEMGIVVGVYDGVPSLMVRGSSFVTGSFLAMAHAVLVAAITSDLFKRGYVKNLIQAKRGPRDAGAVACGVVRIERVCRHVDGRRGHRAWNPLGRMRSCPSVAG